MTDYLLSIIVFAPLIGLIIVLVMPKVQEGGYKWVTLGSTLVQLVFATILMFGFNQYHEAQAGVFSVSAYQFVEQVEWINLNLGGLGKLSIEYFLGVDGLNVTLVFLSALILVVGALASWKIQKKLKGYHALYLLLSTSIVGCFVALDFFLFYLFFEFMLLPMYFSLGCGVDQEESMPLSSFSCTH